MLVLHRKVDEYIQIGEGPDAITIMLVKTFRGAAKIGIVAPGHLKISRPDSPAYQAANPLAAALEKQEADRIQNNEIKKAQCLQQLDQITAGEVSDV